MKKVITTIVAMCFATTLYAQSVTIVNPGSEEGVFRQVLSLIGEQIDHKFIQANNPVTASAYVKNDNVLSMWSSEWPGNPNIQSPAINQGNVLALMTLETLMCSRNFKSLNDMAGKKIKIATWGSPPVAKFLKRLGNTLGATFVVIPYDGSGSMVKGYIAGDADTVFTVTSRQTVLEKDPGTTCFAFSQTGDLKFRFVDAIITVNASADVHTKLQKIVMKLSNTKDWNTKFSGTITTIGNNIHVFDTAVENFSK
jgi:hypothetical protein